MNSVKCPVVRLREMMSLQDKTVSYKLISIGDQMSEAVVDVSVNDDSYVARGNGRTIADAKEVAAVKFLEHLEYVREHTISDKPKIMRKIVGTQLEMSAVGKLQNLCTGRGWSLPSYRYSPGPNESHIFKCTMRKWSAKAVCQTLGQAKESVAEMVFRMIVDHSEPTEDLQSVSDRPPSSLPKSSDLNKIPVSLLQEFCIDKHLHLPVYGEPLWDPVHKTYTVSCKVGPHTENGVERSRKLAKRTASFLVYEWLIKQRKPFERSEYCFDRVPKEFVPTAICCTQPVAHNVRAFSELIRSSDKPNMTRLRTSRYFEYPLDALRDIEDEEGFDVIYTILDENTDVGVVAQVSIGSIGRSMTYVGTGDNNLNAMENAAISGLIHMIQLLN